MTSIVERLRNTREWAGFPAVPICVEAADEIERLDRQLLKERAEAVTSCRALEAEVVRLRESISLQHQMERARERPWWRRLLR